MSSPLASVAPTIFSGSKPLSNPLGLLSSVIFFLFDLSESSFAGDIISNWASYAAIRSGQSKFSSGSQVLSSLKIYSN